MGNHGYQIDFGSANRGVYDIVLILWHQERLLRLGKLSR